MVNHRRDVPDVIKNFHDRLNEMDFSRPIAWKFETYSTVRSIHVGSTVIENQLRSTSTLTKGEMHDFMEKVFHWGLDKGVQLANPEDSEFRRARDAQG